MLDETQDVQDDDRIHEFVAFQFNALSRCLLRSAARQYLSEARMSPPEAWVLGSIANYQPVTAREVAARMDIDEAQVSRAIKSLQASGYVNRRPAAADQRRKILTLTAKGQRAFERIMRLAKRRQGTLLDGLAADEIAVMIDLLDRLRNNAERLLPQN